MENKKRRFRYDTGHKWFKGNAHIHSTVSDGGKNFAELAEMYSRVGYHFLCRADHWQCSDSAADKEKYPLLWLDGMELDGVDSLGGAYHILLIGKLQSINREMGLDAAIESARKQGALVILAHPAWTGTTIEESLRWRFDGVEVYNHIARWLNGKSDSVFHWNSMLKQNAGTLAFAVDDAHLTHYHPGWNGGWIVANTPECSRTAIMDAIRAGNYYSSCGPEFHSIGFDGVNVNIETSPIRFARIAGPASTGERIGTFWEQPFTKVSFKAPSDWEYAYLEIEDDGGKRAWSNTLFIE